MGRARRILSAGEQVTSVRGNAHALRQQARADGDDDETPGGLVRLIGGDRPGTHVIEAQASVETGSPKTVMPIKSPAGMQRARYRRRGCAERDLARSTRLERFVASAFACDAGLDLDTTGMLC